ncbi:MAG: FtsH protease activity modulator HflK [Vallitaleaceae bacterium]|nr:FtsH protease activity modulator HflK [Vallitaleaceae bacterium]
MNDPFNPGKVVDIDTQKLEKTLKKVVPTVVVLIFLAILLFNSIYVIQNGQNGVVLRFGKMSTVVTQAGPHFKIPLVDKVSVVDVKNIHNMEYGFRTTQAGTGTSTAVYQSVPEESTVIVDGANNNASIALIELIIQYKITNPVDYLFNVEDVEGTMRLALEDAVRTSLQSFTLDEAKTQKELIDAAVKPSLQKKMDEYGAGIEIVIVAAQNVKFLPNVETAYQAKENANQYKNGKQEDAERYYNTVIPQAEAEATQLVESAHAYKAETIAAANAGVAQFNALYSEYINNPTILKEKYYIEALTTFLKNNNVVIDATETGDMNKFYNLNQSDLAKEKIDSLPVPTN